MSDAEIKQAITEAMAMGDSVKEERMPPPPPRPKKKPRQTSTISDVFNFPGNDTAAYLKSIAKSKKRRRSRKKKKKKQTKKPKKPKKGSKKR